MAVSVKYCLVILSLGLAVTTGDALKCHICNSASCPNAADTRVQMCTTAQDTCFKFEGDVVTDGRHATGLTTRGCVSLSTMREYPPAGTVQARACANVSQSKDPYQAEIFTGRFCLCDTDLCNKSSLVTSSLYLFGLSLLTAFFAFRI